MERSLWSGFLVSWESLFYLMSILSYKWKASLLLIIPSFFLVRNMHSYWTAMHILGTTKNMFDLGIVLISLGPLSRTEERKYVMGWWWVLSKNKKHLAHGKFSKMLAITIFKTICMFWDKSLPNMLIYHWRIKHGPFGGEKKTQPPHLKFFLVCITILHI